MTFPLRKQRLRDAVSRILRHGTPAFMLPVMALSVSPHAMAVTLPADAGTVSNQTGQLTPPSVPEVITPELPSLPLPSSSGRSGNDSAYLILRQVVLSGAPASAGHAADAVIRSFTGRRLNMNDLRDLTSRLTALYRQQGMMLARVILPPQTVRDGVLHLTILPGINGHNDLVSDAPVWDALLSRMMQDALPEGETVTRERMERLALLVGEIPGVSGRLQLAPGQHTGETAITLHASRTQRAGGYVGANNQSSPVTGRSRIFAGAWVNGLAGTGDRLSAEGSLGYEHNGLVNGRLDYSTLVSPYGTRAGISYSRLDYRYTFSSLKFRGWSDNWEARVVHPLVRSGRAQVNLRASAGQSFMTDRYPSPLDVVGDEGKKTATTGSIGIAGNALSTPGGVTGGSLDFITGRVRYRDTAATFWSGADMRHSDDSFFTTVWQLRHEQTLYGPFTAMAQVRGQFTNRNLDSSQKFLLGGAVSVRAYDVGAGAVDDGAVATAEVRWRHALPATAWTGGSPFVTLGSFFDYGQGRQNHNNTLSGSTLSTQNQVQLAGGGVYATLGVPDNWSLSATLARRATGEDPVSGERDDYRAWLSAVKMF
ncbi:TPA: ShlB/FhaC/HecB family hemolysin secretion/activation protein [Escherichia coli]|nr:ShlB/FhaC/HecB family hemolysin secretion/activation protein [Escherichia coli]